MTLDVFQMQQCDNQGKLFESLDRRDIDAKTFIKAFMSSRAAAGLDSTFDHFQWAGNEYIYEDVVEEFSLKPVPNPPRYNTEALYWGGYITRYWHYLTGETSKEIYAQCDENRLLQSYGFHSEANEMAIADIKAIAGQCAQSKERKCEMKAITFIMVVAFAVAANAAEKHWLGTDVTSPTLASVAANWDPSGAPTADDDVVLDAGSNNNPMTWDLDNGVKSWTQSDYTGTVTFKTGTTAMYSQNTYTCYGVTQADGSKALEIAGNLTLSSGTWTHETTPGMTSTSKGMNLWKKGFGVYRMIVKVGGDCTIASGATIDVNSKGFGIDGPGYGMVNNATTPGNCASHAGFGGYYYGSQTNATFIYGSTKMPVSLGTGRDTKGGGAVRLSITGTLALDGTISAIGTTDKNYPGSGGSIWITADSLSGAGSASVNGGAGASGAGSGGGGRIAVYLTGDDADFSDFTGTFTSWNRTNYGTCGTVYLETAADNGVGKLVLACGTNASESHQVGSKEWLCTPLKAGDTNEYVFSTVEFSNWTNLGIMPGVTVTVARVSASSATRNLITLYGGALKLNGDNGNFTMASATLRTCASESSISVGDNGAGTLNLASGAAMPLNAPTLVNGLLVATGTLRIGADVTVRDFQLPKKSTVYLNGHVLTVTNPAKRKSLSVLGTVDTGDGGEIVWPQRGLRLIFR